MAKRSRGRADSIQKEIDQAAIKAGAGVVACSQYPMLGYDRQYLYGGGIFTCEIKSNRRAKLTKQEIRRLNQYRLHNVPFYIIYSVEDLYLALGITKPREK